MSGDSGLPPVGPSRGPEWPPEPRKATGPKETPAEGITTPEDSVHLTEEAQRRAGEATNAPGNVADVPDVTKRKTPSADPATVVRLVREGANGLKRGVSYLLAAMKIKEPRS